MVISKSLRSKSKDAPATPLSPSKAKLKISDKSRPPKKSREDESKIMRRRRRTSNYGFDRKKGAAEQDNQCAVAALAHFNQEAASKLGVTYELVKAGMSAAFMPGHLQPAFLYHSNFTAKPTNCTDGAQTVLFFTELYEPYVCLGDNGCKTCGPGNPVIHHPGGGFYPGAGFCSLSPSP